MMLSPRSGLGEGVRWLLLGLLVAKDPGGIGEGELTFGMEYGGTKRPVW